MIFVFYHSVDFDGHCSGAIVKYFYKQKGRENEVELVPFNYTNEIDISKFKKEDIVYFVDVVPQPFNKLYIIEELVDKVIIFDHHKTFIESPEGNYFSKQPTSKLQTDLAGCQLTWHGMFPDERRMPVIITLLGEYDRWNDTDSICWNNQILPFQYGMRIDKTDPLEYFEYWYSWFDLKVQWNRIQEVIDRGKIIIKYENLQNEYVMRSSFEYTYKTNRCLCVNSTTRNSNLFKSKWDENKYDVMVVYSQNKGNWWFSVYTSKEDVDVSLIAKQLGGGGHRKAAGFSVKKLEDFFIA